MDRVKEKLLFVQFYILKTGFLQKIQRFLSLILVISLSRAELRRILAENFEKKNSVHGHRNKPTLLCLFRPGFLNQTNEDVDL